MLDFVLFLFYTYDSFPTICVGNTQRVVILLKYKRMVMSYTILLFSIQSFLFRLT